MGRGILLRHLLLRPTFKIKDLTKKKKKHFTFLLKSSVWLTCVKGFGFWETSESYTAEQDIFSQVTLMLGPIHFHSITVNFKTFVF